MPKPLKKQKEIPPKPCCPIRVHPYGEDYKVPLCGYLSCSHILLPNEKICPCHFEPKKCCGCGVCLNRPDIKTGEDCVKRYDCECHQSKPEVSPEKGIKQHLLGSLYGANLIIETDNEETLRLAKEYFSHTKRKCCEKCPGKAYFHMSQFCKEGYCPCALVVSPAKEEKELCPIECQREHPSTHHNTPTLAEQKGGWEPEFAPVVDQLDICLTAKDPRHQIVRVLAAKKKEWESALLEKIKEEVGNMRHYSLCHRIDAHGCSFVGKFHGTKEELAERIQAVEELLRILNNLK